MTEKIFTCEEIAERYQVQKTTVWTWIRTGQLRAMKLGKIYRIRESDLETFEKTKFTKT